MNTTIAEQIEINKQAYLIASKSKESAIKFLEDAGIIKKQNGTVTSKQRSSSTAKK